MESDDLLSDPATAATAQASISANGLDCRAFNGYTASLATLTVDCLGTIRPDSFQVTAEGTLQRSFDSCTLDATHLESIDAILSLQLREARLPHVKECIAGHYADFVREFADTGVTACPAWQKIQTVNPITASVVDSVTPHLRYLDTSSADEQAAAPSELLAVPDELEEKNLYRASFAGSGTPVSAESAGASAAACAGGFAGFVLQNSGDAVLTDPPAWQLETTYPDAQSDPYLRAPGYYHPMSYYGSLPGALFGNANRYRPCPTCPPETCSFYSGLHLKTKLQLDCLDPNIWSTCVSYCGPPLH